MRILVIEPDLVSAKLLKTFFEQVDVAVLLAHDAQGAIHELDTGQVDCIVLEPAMANHNGVEFLYELRSYSEWQDVPLVIYSGLSERTMRLNTALQKQLHIAKLCYKPITSLPELHKAIRSAFAVTKVAS